MTVKESRERLKEVMDKWPNSRPMAEAEAKKVREDMKGLLVKTIRYQPLKKGNENKDSPKNGEDNGLS
ncbi:MAG: hypothetical protein MUE99_01955 [Chitinophagaceae bacterium]|nr:hypothetical protein [Chitinophagaceae bacterium]